MARGTTRHASHDNHFVQTDASAYILGLPKSRTRLGTWGVVAVVAGTILALGLMMLMVALESLQF